MKVFGGDHIRPVASVEAAGRFAILWSVPAPAGFPGHRRPEAHEDRQPGEGAPAPGGGGSHIRRLFRPEGSEVQETERQGTEPERRGFRLRRDARCTGSH